jgi:hypothetical protein
MFTSIKVWDAGVAAKAHRSPAGRHGQPNLSHSELYLCKNEYLQALKFCLNLGMPTIYSFHRIYKLFPSPPLGGRGDLVASV